MNEKELAQVANCAMCANMCKHSCPTFLATGSETITPQKIARLILYEEKDLLEDRRGFYDVMFRTSMCGACRVHCIYDDYDLRKFVQMGRGKAFKEGMLPDETRKRVETFKRFGNPHGERELLDRGTGEVGYMVSCSAYKDASLLQAMDRVIGAGGVQVRRFGGGEICCGAPLYYAGDTEGFREAAEKMKGEIESRKLRRVVADCPTCLTTMSRVYGEMGVHLDVELIHVTEFLRDLLDGLDIKKREPGSSATYHDPCILANDLGITTAPRQVLEALGFEIREPVFSGQDAHCCGAVCGAKIGDCGLAGKVSSMRVGELKATGADVYVTACATCKSVLSGAGTRHLVELAAEQIGGR